MLSRWENQMRLGDFLVGANEKGYLNIEADIALTPGRYLTSRRLNLVVLSYIRNDFLEI